jgi:hypothetical protein
MTHSTYLEAVEYNNFVAIDSKLIADVDDYDHYISVVNSSYDRFNNEFLKAFNTKNAVGFFGLNDVLPVDLPIGLFKKQLSSERTVNTVNLEFYTNNFKNMFLRMDVNGDEVEWFNYISEDKLRNFKQILIVLDPTVNETAFKKLNNSHDIVYIQTENDKLVITYLRKDAITDYKPTRKIGKFVGLSGSPPWRKIEETNILEIPVSEPIVVEEPLQDTIVVEEPVSEPVVVEESVQDSLVVEDPVVEETVFVEETVVAEEIVFEEHVVAEEIVSEEHVVSEEIVSEEHVVFEEIVSEEHVVSEEIVSEEHVVADVSLEEHVSEEHVVSEVSLETHIVSYIGEESIVLVSEETGVDELVIEETVVDEKEKETLDLDEEFISDDSCEDQPSTTEEPTEEQPVNIKKRGRPRKQK